MWEILQPPLVVTVIGMTIIFVVLGVLYFSIIALEKVFPHTEPPAPPPSEDETETVAIIQAAVSAYLKRKVKAVSVKPAKK